MTSDFDLAAVLEAPWYVQPNDLIGGWCVTAINEPPSTGRGPAVADMVLDKAIAERIVKDHNRHIVIDRH
jgi:hypothetical protein